MFGPLALLAPFLGFVLAWLLGQKINAGGGGDMRGLAALAYMFLVLFCALIVGGIAALIGLARAEKFRALGWMGLVLNFGPVLAFLLGRWMRKG